MSQVLHTLTRAAFAALPSPALRERVRERVKIFHLIIILVLFNISFASAQQLPAAEAPPVSAPKPDWMNYRTPYGGEAQKNTLASPHRTTDEIIVIAGQIGVELLSLDTATYKEKLAEFKKYFVPQGWQLYAAYLKDTDIIGKVRDNGYSMRAIANGSADIVSQSAVNNVYHWVVKIPLTVSLAAAGAESSEKQVLFMDMMRVTEADGNNGLAIVNWRMDSASAP